MGRLIPNYYLISYKAMKKKLEMLAGKKRMEIDELEKKRKQALSVGNLFCFLFCFSFCFRFVEYLSDC